MGTKTLVSVEEYLRSDYEPDMDYVDGELEERNMGDTDHGLLQALLTAWLVARRRVLGLQVFVETRMRVSTTRFRIPDICVYLGEERREQILSKPPFLCIEILSPEDRVSRMNRKIRDYLEMGVRYVWVIDPADRSAWIHTAQGAVPVEDGVLRTADPAIEVPLAELV